MAKSATKITLSYGSHCYVSSRDKDRGPASLTVTATINGYTGSDTISGTFGRKISGMNSGTITIYGVFKPTTTYSISGSSKATVASNSHTLSYSGSTTVYIDKISPSSLTIKASTAKYDYGTSDPVTLSGKLSDVVNTNTFTPGYVKIFRDGSQIGTANIDVKDGSYTYNINTQDASVGTHTYFARYSGNTFYNSVADSSSVSMEVSKITPTALSCTRSVDSYNYGSSDNVYLSGSLGGTRSDSPAGVVAVYRDGVFYQNANIASDGTWTLSLDTTGAGLGDHTYYVKYNGNQYYNKFDSNSDSVTITVNKGTHVVTVERTSVSDEYPGVQKVKVTVKNEKGDAISTSVSGSGKSLDVSGHTANGVVEFTVSGLDIGTYNDWVFTSAGNDYYNAASATLASFNIEKTTPSFTPLIDKSIIYYMDSVVVSGTINTPGDYKPIGTVTATDGERSGTYSLTESDNGHFEITLNNLNVGSKTFTVTYAGDEHYKEATKSISQSVVPYIGDVIINSVTPFNSVYGDTVTIKGMVNHPTGGLMPKGTVKLTLDNLQNTSDVDANGEFTITIAGARPGSYSEVTKAQYIPSADETNYVGASPKSISFDKINIIKFSSSVVNLNLVDAAYYYNGRVTVTGNVAGLEGTKPTGKVKLFMDGDDTNVAGEYTLDGRNDKFNITVTGLTVGEHYFTVHYDGDNYYINSESNTAKFTVEPVIVNFKYVVSHNGQYNGSNPSASVDVTVEPLHGGAPPEGYIEIELADGSRKWTASLVEGTANVGITKLAPELYENVKVTYKSQNANYNDTVWVNTVSFKIEKGVPEFIIDAPSVGYGQDAYLYIILPDDAEGTVRVTGIGDTDLEFDVGAGNRSYKIAAPQAGAFDLKATYTGDANYTDAKANTTLYIERPGAYLDINVDDINYGQDAEIEFLVYSNSSKESVATKARGTIQVFGLDNDDGYKVEIKNGKGYLTVSGLPMGGYNIVAVYSGDNDLAGTVDVKKFYVKGLESDVIITLNASTINVGDDLLVTVQLNNTINDSIYLYVDGEKYGGIIAENGKAVFTVSGLTSGEHVINATFLQNEAFQGNTNSTTVTVGKMNVDYTVDLVSDSQRNVFFTINVNKDVTGVIKVISDSKKYTLEIEDGVAERIIPAGAGVFTYNITYAGDEKYNAFNTSRTIDTTKVSNYDMDISNTNATLNLPITVYVTLPKMFDGSDIKLVLDGDEYHKTLTNGLAVFDDNIIVKSTGEILAVATFEGTGNYSGRTINKTIPVNPTDYDLEIVMPEIVHVGDNLHIAINAPTGLNKVNVTLNGKTKEINVADGYNITDIDEGQYYFVVSYVGDVSFIPKENSTTFNVVKQNTPIDVVINAAEHGENTTIDITLNKGVTGLILVDIDGIQYYYANLTTNTVHIVDDAFESGNHTIHVKYIGDRKYNANSAYENFTIAKNDDYLFDVTLNEVIIPDKSKIKVIAGEQLVFGVELPGDAKGTITFVISNAEGMVVFEKVLTLPTNLLITNIKDIGLYDLKVTYGGSVDYISSSNEFVLNVTSSNIISKVNFAEDRPDYLVGEASTLDITGNLLNTPINVLIDGILVTTVTINGESKKGTINLPGLSAGNHTVTLMFDGNEEFTALTTSTNITVVKHDSRVVASLESSDLVVGDTIIINIEASGNGTATVTLSNDTFTKSYDVVIKDGVGRLVVVDELASGNYNMKVVYNGDDYYKENTYNGAFTVSDKIDATLDFVLPVFEVKEDSTIGVTSNFEDGSVTVYVDGEKQGVFDIAFNKGTISLPGLAAGNHSVQVVYDGSHKYNNLTTSFIISVNIRQSDISISLEKSKIYVGDDAVVIIKLPSEATGLVLVTVNDDNYFVKVTDGTGKLNIPNLKNGTHTITAEYTGNELYNASKDSVAVEVYKVSDYLMDVVSSPIVNNSSDVTVTLPEDAKGTVSIRVNNKTFTGKLLGGQVIIEVTDLLDGDNNFTVYYPGDDKYTDSEYSGVISVDGTHIETSLVVSAPEIYVGDEGVITVTLPRDATGVVSISVGGKNYAIILKDGVGTLPAPNLAYGTYNVTATYNGDSKYSAVSNKTVFKVNKKLPVMDIVAGDVDAGANNKVTVSVPADATGVITIDVNGTKYVGEIKNGVAEFNVATTISGVYTVVATYNGDAKYLNNTFTTTFAAGKVNSTIDVVIPNAEIGKNVTITVNTPKDATGSVTITVDGKDYTANVNDGKAVFSVLVGVFDDYTVSVKYSGDAKYNPSSATGIISTFKANTTINVVAGDIYVGDNAVVDVTLAKDASGSVTITINGKKYVVPVSNGVVSLPVSELGEGDYEVNVIYSGDAKYNGIEGNASFKVSKRETPIDISAPDINVGEDAVITVTVPADITGELTINVDGTNHTEPISKGQATVVIPDLKAGMHNVSVTYGGDDKYLTNSSKAVFNVEKLESELSINVNDIKVGSQAAVTVTVPAGATGTVTVTVNGKNYTKTIDNDKAEFTIDAIDVSGKYPVVASYAGDDKYVGNSTTVEFAVSKYVLAPTVSSTVINDNKANITVGNLSDATGNVIISVGGANYSAPIDGDKAVVNVSGLVNEANDIVITYAGDYKYESFVNKAQVTRDGKVKLAPSIIVLADDGVADKAIKVWVILPADATGNVTITVNGKEYTNVTKNGIATFSNVTIPVSGEFSVNASYSGNDKYLTAANSTTTNIDKVNSTISVGDIAIKVGENALIKVILPADANGTVTITVNGKPETIDVVAGEPVELNVSGLGFGNYDVDVTYSGNGKYNANSTTATIAVDKNALDIKVNVSDIDAGEKATITVTVPSDVTGTVVVSVKGKNYKLTPSNGVASVKVPKLPAGEYDVVASYAGDNKYVAGSDNSSFKVKGLNTELDISVDGDVVARGDVVITVGVDKADATGTITIRLDGNELTSDIVDGKAVFNTTLGTGGQHNLTAVYSGDTKYNSTEKTQVIDVAKLTPTITVDASDIKYEEDAVVVVNLPGDATGNVTLTIGNEFTHTVNIEDGKATFEIEDLSIGTKVLNIVYNGDDYYDTLTDNKNSFKVTRAVFTPDVDAYLDDGRKSDISIYVPDLTGTLDVIVGNKAFNNLPISGGKVVIPASELADVEGNNFTIIYAGDTTYEPVEYSGVITGEGSKLNSTINIDAENTVIGENTTITVTVPYAATGNVTVKVNGKEYTGEIVNGKVVFSVLADVVGEINVDASYDGDDLFLKSSNSTTFNVAKLSTPISIDAKDIKLGEDAVITVTVNNQATGNVTITVGGKDYTENVDNGTAKFTVSNLTGGVKEIVAKYSGDSKYGENTTSISINVTRESVTPVVNANLTEDGTLRVIILLLSILVMISMVL